MKILKKSLVVAALSMGLAFAGGNAFAAELSNANGQSCTGDGSWHFINNQTQRAASPGHIDVWFSCDHVGAYADKVNRNNQHFNVTTSGACTLLDAYTTLPGRLVLSDFSCDTKCEKDCEPPPK